MTIEEAIAACEFWTTNEAETIAIGSTRNPEVGLFFNVPEQHTKPACEWSDPNGPRYYAISVSSTLTKFDEDGVRYQAPNPIYAQIVEEIDRRKGQKLKEAA